jgi:hypothetical protein
MLSGTAAVLALVGSTAAHAQGVYVVEPYAAVPAPVYVAPQPYAAAPPVVVAPAPGYVTVAPPMTYVVPRDEEGYVPPYTAGAYTVVNSFTGRRCTIKPDGYRWCWTP